MACTRPVAALAFGLVLLAQPAAAQTLEERRYADELKACAQRPEAERKACEDTVRAKIKADWKARIEIESRRRQSR